MIVTDCDKKLVSFTSPAAKVKQIEIKLDNISRLNALAVDPKGATIIIAELSDGITLVDVDSQSIIKRLAVGSVNCVCWSESGMYIASGSISGHIITIDSSTFTIIKKSNSHTKSVNSVAFSPSSRFLVSGSEDSTIIVHKSPELSKIKILKGHIGFIYSAVFLSENQLISGGDDKCLHVWNVQSGEVAKVIKEDLASSIYSISVSPGGKYFLCEGASYSLHVFEVNSLRLTKTVVKLPGSICSLSFISDTTVIAGVMNSGILAIDITTGVISIIANSLVYAYPAGVAYRNTIPDNMVSVYRNTLTIIIVSTGRN